MNPVDALTAAAGQWLGANPLQDPNTGRPEESPSAATVTPVVGGRFTRVDDTWGYQGKSREGSLLVGSDPKLGEVSGYWIDTWHMGRMVLACVGTAGDGTITLRGSSPAPPGPDWGSRIEIEPGEDALRIGHTNILPDGVEESAAEGVYSRS